jgi:hypothetical protein
MKGSIRWHRKNGLRKQACPTVRGTKSPIDGAWCPGRGPQKRLGIFRERPALSADIGCPGPQDEVQPDKRMVVMRQKVGKAGRPAVRAQDCSLADAKVSREGGGRDAALRGADRVKSLLGSRGEAAGLLLHESSRSLET